MFGEVVEIIVIYVFFIERLSILELVGWVVVLGGGL